MLQLCHYVDYVIQPRAAINTGFKNTQHTHAYGTGTRPGELDTISQFKVFQSHVGSRRSWISNWNLKFVNQIISKICLWKCSGYRQP